MGRLSGKYRVINKYAHDRAIRKLDEIYKTPYVRTYKVGKTEDLEQSLSQAESLAYKFKDYLKPIQCWICNSTNLGEVVVSIDTNCDPELLLKKLDEYCPEKLVSGNQREMKV